MPTLTIGIIHNASRKVLIATVKSLRRSGDLDDAEVIVVGVRDTQKTRAWVERQPDLRYVGSGPDHVPAALDQVFATASGDVVLVLEGPVRLKRGALAALRSYYDAHPASRDLLHGPLMDGRRVLATHSNPFWQGNSWGKRSRDPRGLEIDGERFVIPMQESGVFCCRRVAWPGLPQGWRGYGAEAGYFQEQVRRGGGQVFCLPGLRWERTSPPRVASPHSPESATMLRNHYAGAAELGLDTAYIALRYRDYLAPGEAGQLRTEVLRQHEPIASAASPLVSCLLYAGQLVPLQQTLLEEAVESFLRQDYPHRELILLNDQPEQFLVCEAPGVRVVNTSSRCPSLGACYNAAAAFAQGDLLAPWGATSINLPWRLSQSVATLQSHSVFRPDDCWYMLDGELDDRPARPDGGQVALFTREAFQAVGGYPAMTLGLHREMDAALDAWLETSGQPRPDQNLPRDSWFTIVRRTQDDVQYTGDPFLDPWQAAGQLPTRKGRCVLQPHWADDYPALCRGRLSSDDIVDSPVSHVAAFMLGRRRHGKGRWLPREDQKTGQSSEQHLERVAALLDAAAAAGGTHLVIPQAEASWLSLHPHIGDFLTARHWLVEANPETGFIFALNDAESNPLVAGSESSGG